MFKGLGRKGEAVWCEDQAVAGDDKTGLDESYTFWSWIPIYCDQWGSAVVKDSDK